MWAAQAAHSYEVQGAFLPIIQNFIKAVSTTAVILGAVLQ